MFFEVPVLINMRKVLFLTVFFFITCTLGVVYAFAKNIPNEYLYIEGTAENEDYIEFFLWIFNIEAAGTGYIVTESKNEAAYTFRFDITPNVIEDDEGIQHPADDNLYSMRISLIDNSNDEEILHFYFFFSYLEDIFDYSQLIFQKAVVYIPPYRTEADTVWQGKWLYVRASLDYPVSFYALQPAGLFGGQAAYFGDDISLPNNIQRLDNIIFPQPGITLGAELQFLNFLSFELNLQIKMGDPTTNFFTNFALGANIKFNFKTSYFMFQPYGTLLIPLNVSNVFNEYPSFAAGGGIQIGVWGGRNGMFFIDVNYLNYFGNVHMKNIYTFAPNPPFIQYKHFVFGIGAGYKFGFFNR